MLLYKQVYQALSPAHGGRADASIAEVAARMARAKVGKSYGSAKEALLLSASFVAAQLQNTGDANAAFISSLTAEVFYQPSACLKHSLVIRRWMLCAREECPE